MYDELNKINQEELLELYKEIDKNYKDVDLDIAEPKYDKNDKLTNEKEVKNDLKKVIPIISAIWITNKAITDTKSQNVISNTLLFYSLLETKIKPSKTLITKKEWTKIVEDVMKKRAKKVKINTVIKGNAKRLNKNIQRIVLDGYKSGKSKLQIAKELQKTMKFNKNKAKSIATTEINFYKSEAQLEATKGLEVTKTWIHNAIAREPRGTHINANGQTVKGRKTKFTVGGKKTIAPQHFGIPSEDINCHCTMRVELVDDVKVSKKEIRKVIK